MSNKPRIPLQGGDEYDALTKAKQFYYWAAGQRKQIKRGYNKRVRKAGRHEVLSGKEIENG